MTENCSNLETELLSEFHYFEKLKLQVKKQSECKSVNFLLQSDFDPNLNSKFETINKLHLYLKRELSNLYTFKENKKKELKESLNKQVPLHEIYDLIKQNNLSIRYQNGQINKIIEKLKFARLSRTVLRDMNTNLSSPSLRLKRVNTPTTNMKAENDENGMIEGTEQLKLEDTSFDLITQISQINLQLDESTCETNEEKLSKLSGEAKFFSQLFDVLRKRNKVATQTIDLNKLELLDSKFDQKTSTQMVLNDSFLSLKTQQSPKVSQPVFKQETQVKAPTPVPEVAKPQFQIQPHQQQPQPKPVELGVPTIQPVSKLLPAQPVPAQKPVPLTSTPFFGQSTAKTNVPNIPSTPFNTNAPFSFNASTPVNFGGLPKPDLAPVAPQQQPSQSNAQKSLFPTVGDTKIAPAQPVPAPEQPKEAQSTRVAQSTSLFSVGPSTGAQQPAFSFNMGKTTQPAAAKEAEKIVPKEKEEPVKVEPLKPASEPVKTQVEPPKEAAPDLEKKPSQTSLFSISNVLGSSSSAAAQSQTTPKSNLFGGLSSSQSSGPAFSFATNQSKSAFSFGGSTGGLSSASSNQTIASAVSSTQNLTQPPKETAAVTTIAAPIIVPPVEAPKVEVAKPEATKAEVPKVEPSKVEAPKEETPKAETPVVAPVAQDKVPAVPAVAAPFSLGGQASSATPASTNLFGNLGASTSFSNAFGNKTVPPTIGATPPASTNFFTSVAQQQPTKSILQPQGGFLNMGTTAAATPAAPAPAAASTGGSLFSNFMSKPATVSNPFTAVAAAAAAQNQKPAPNQK